MEIDGIIFKGCGVHTLGIFQGVFPHVGTDRSKLSTAIFDILTYLLSAD